MSRTRSARLGSIGLLVISLLGCEIGFPVDDDDDVGDPSVAPALSALTFEPDYEHWRLVVEFNWSDPQKNVREGRFFSYVNGTLLETIDLSLGNDMVTLASDSGEYRTDLGPFASPVPVELGLEIEDTDGNRSERLVHEIDLERFFFDEQEANDTMEAAQNLGGIQLPAAILGDLLALDEDVDGNYAGDMDYFRFSLHPDFAGNVWMTLWWENGAELELQHDLGFFVKSDSGTVVMQDEHDLFPPEEAGAPLTASTPYFIAVAGKYGDPVSYVLLLEPPN